MPRIWPNDSVLNLCLMIAIIIYINSYLRSILMYRCRITWSQQLNDPLKHPFPLKCQHLVLV